MDINAICKTLTYRHITGSGCKHPILILFFLLINITVIGQEPEIKIEKSNEKVLIDGEIYFIHIVKKGETIYSICKAYDIPPKVLSKENPSVIIGLQSGQVLKIPDNPPEEIDEQESGKYIFHSVKMGETFYFISRLYNVSVQEIVDLNSDIDFDDIPTGTIVKIPRIEFQPERQKFITPDEDYFYYRVKRGETYYSISRELGISVRKLRKANRDKRKGLEAGDIIRIPRTPETIFFFTQHVPGDIPEELCYTEIPAYFDNSVKAALLLPFYLNENEKREFIDSSKVNQYGKRIYKIIKRDKNWIYPKSYKFIEFYEGALMAVDDLRKRGMSVELFVFDTDQDPEKVKELASSGYLDEMDLIIGPAYSMNVAVLNDYLNGTEVPVICPFIQKDDLLHNNPGLFEVVPSHSVESEILSRVVASDFDKNIVLIHPGDSLEYERIELFKWKLLESLEKYGPLEHVVLKEVFFSETRTRRDTINEIEDALLPRDSNIVVILSEKETFVSEVLAKLFILSKDYNLKVYGFPEWQQFRNIQLEYFHQMGVYICSIYYLDYRKKSVQDFLRKYRDKFHTEPIPFSFAWSGYDILYYFLTGLGTYGDKFMECFSSHKADLLVSDFHFEKLGEYSGAMNRKMYLLHFTKNLQVIPVAFPPYPQVVPYFEYK